MKIVKRGTKHLEQNIGTIECPKCESILRVNREDFREQEPDRPGESPCKIANCPVCKGFLPEPKVSWGAKKQEVEWQTVEGNAEFLDEDGEMLEVDATKGRVFFFIGGRSLSFYPGDIPEIVNKLSSFVKEKQ
jgi:hypothetical protein